MENITPLTENHINHAILIELSVSNNIGEITTYYFSTAYKPITWSGHTYTALGSFLSIGNIQGDISGSNDEVSIGLSGIEPSTMAFVLDDTAYRIKGSPIKIRRAFFDETTQELQSGQVYLRYSGYVTNYSVDETLDVEASSSTNTITISCASVHSILENRVSGRRTNPGDYKIYYDERYISEAITTDPSMDLVPSLHNAGFDFGKPYKAPTGVRGGGNAGGINYDVQLS